MHVLAVALTPSSPSVISLLAWQDGRTALIEASYNCSTEAVKVLLANKANTEAKDRASCEQIRVCSISFLTLFFLKCCMANNLCIILDVTEMYSSTTKHIQMHATILTTGRKDGVGLCNRKGAD